MRIDKAQGRQSHEPALIVSDCINLTSLPDDLALGGPIDVAGSGLTNLPPTLAHRCRLLWRGMAVHPDVVFHPEKLSPRQILDERNTELRRLMLERVGFDAVLEEGHAKFIDKDTDPGGQRRLLDVTEGGRISRYLYCRCPSTQREYLLRVPPQVPTCHAAAAWLAGFQNPDDYKPVQET